ncbi:MAG: ABC transporter permease, partial [Actinomycetota bacterium]|nr:ABC transporter permease [Actinomycetota bacterium]
VGLVLTASTDGALPRAGLGALLVVVGMVLLGPIAAGPVGRVLGAPLELRGVPGELAQRNAARNPRRTAGTAASLLVGVGVVTLFTVFGSSMQASIEEAVDRSFGGDLVVEGGGFSGAGLSTTAIDDIAALPEVGDVSGLGWGTARLDGEEREVGFADLAALTRITDFDIVEGDLADVDAHAFAISTDKAEQRGWGLGDIVDAEFTDGAVVPLEVAAIYDDRAMGGDLLLPAATWSAHTAAPRYEVALIGLADGVSLDEGVAAVEQAVVPYGRPDVQDRDGFIESEASEINTLLGVIYGLLAIAIVIALLGIANTLSLSIHERTRELGLLRAVGQSRSQVRAMVRWESVLVALFGAIGGIGMGVFLGWGVVRAMNAAEGFGTLDVPVGSLVTVLVVGAVAGVIAGLRPAAKAARLDVLQALAAT